MSVHLCALFPKQPGDAMLVRLRNPTHEEARLCRQPRHAQP